MTGRRVVRKRNLIRYVFLPRCLTSESDKIMNRWRRVDHRASLRTSLTCVYPNRTAGVAKNESKGILDKNVTKGDCDERTGATSSRNVQGMARRERGAHSPRCSIRAR